LEANYTFLRSWSVTGESLESLATIAGHLNILQWLDEMGYHPDFFTLEIASVNQYHHILKWLDEEKDLRETLVMKEQRESHIG
jgi:hypothetical protein